MEEPLEEERSGEGRGEQRGDERKQKEMHILFVVQEVVV